MVGEDKLANHSTEADKDSTLEKPERVCYETKIIGGAVVRIPVRKVRTDRNSYLISNLTQCGVCNLSVSRLCIIFFNEP